MKIHSKSQIKVLSLKYMGIVSAVDIHSTLLMTLIQSNNVSATFDHINEVETPFSKASWIQIDLTREVSISRNENYFEEELCEMKKKLGDMTLQDILFKITRLETMFQQILITLMRFRLPLVKDLG